MILPLQRSKTTLPEVIHKYGIEWMPVITEEGDVISYTEADIEMECFFLPEKAKSKGAKLLSPLEHFRNLVSCFWPEPIWIHNKVSDLIFDTLIHNEIIGIRGSAGLGKTACLAIWTKIRQEFYREKYAAHIFSHSESGLRIRYWRDCIYFHRMAQTPMFGFPDVHNLCIRANLDNSSLGIICRAVRPFTDLEREASSLSGAHGALCVDVVIEEADTVRESIFASIYNISSGVPDFRFVALCNPVKKTGTMGKFCEPIEGYDNFDVMTPNTHKYKLNYSTLYSTKAGVALRLDARDSPALEEPERFPFLIGKKTIEIGKKLSGISTLQDIMFYNTMGWLQDSINENAFSVITDSDVENKCLLEDIEFIEEPIRCAAIDMSYRGTDRKIFWPCEIGKCIIDDNQTYAIRLLQPSYIEGETSSYRYYEQVAEKMANLIRAYQISPQHVSIDSSSVQDVFPEMLSKALGVSFLIHGTSFQKWSEDDKCYISVSDPRDSREICYDRATELHVLVQEFIRRKQIRTAHPDYVRELIKEGKLRHFVPEGKNGKRKIENKMITKDRNQEKSPDHLDCLCIMANIARDILGIFPGAGIDKKLHFRPKKNSFTEIVSRLRKKTIAVNRPVLYAK